MIYKFHFDTKCNKKDTKYYEFQNLLYNNFASLTWTFNPEMRIKSSKETVKYRAK